MSSNEETVKTKKKLNRPAAAKKRGDVTALRKAYEEYYGKKIVS